MICHGVLENEYIMEPVCDRTLDNTKQTKTNTSLIQTKQTKNKKTSDSQVEGTVSLLHLEPTSMRCPFVGAIVAPGLFGLKNLCVISRRQMQALG